MAERYDFDAVAADDALLDLLAAGGDGAFELRDGGDDPAIQLLAELRLAVEEIDEQPNAVLIDAEAFLGRVAARDSGSHDPLARKIATRSLALSVAAVAALSVSGVAAAVGGDPLAPYEKVIERVVDAVSPQTSFPVDKINGLVIGSKRKMIPVEKDWVSGVRHKTGQLSTGIDDETTTAASEFERSIGLTQRTVARPKPPFVLPTDKPADVKPTNAADEPVATGDTGKTDNGKSDDKADKGNNGKGDDKGNGKPSDDSTTAPSTDPTTPVTPPTTEPTPTGEPTSTPTPTEEPTQTPSGAGDGQQGQNTDGDSQQGNGSSDNGNNGNGNGKGSDSTDQTGELEGSPSTQPSTDQPSSQSGSETSIQPSAELSAPSSETSSTGSESTPGDTSGSTEAPAAQADPAAIVHQSLTNAISANAAAKRHGKHHHSARPADVRKASAHARHARREHADGRKQPDIVDTRLLAAVTSQALGAVAVLGG